MRAQPVQMLHSPACFLSWNLDSTSSPRPLLTHPTSLICFPLAGQGLLFLVVMPDVVPILRWPGEDHLAHNLSVNRSGASRQMLLYTGCFLPGHISRNWGCWGMAHGLEYK